MSKDTIRVRRGLKSKMPSLLVGEPYMTLDTYELFIGTYQGNQLIGVGDDIAQRMNSLENEYETMLSPTTFESMKNQTLDFNTFKFGYVDAKLSTTIGVNVLELGAVGDGVADDTDFLQEAIDVSVEFGVPVLLGNRTYKITRTLTGSSNLKMIGQGATIDYRSIPKLYNNGVATAEVHALDVYGSTGASVALTENAVEMAQSITVTDASGFAPDDWVQIISEDFYPYSGTFQIPRGEIKQIRSISGNTLTFTTVLWEGYTTANTAKVRKVNFAENIHIQGVQFLGSNADQLTTNNREVGIALYFCKNFVIEGNKFYGQDFIGVRVRSCILGNVIGNDIKGAYRKSDLSKGTVYYGVAVQNNSQWVYVGHNKGATLRRLGVCTATQTDYGQAYHIIFQGNQFRDSHSGSSGRVEGFEHHGFGRWITFDANQTDSSLGGVRIEGRDVIVSNNIFTNCVGSGVVLDNDAGIFENILIVNNHISRPIEDGTSSVGYGVEIELVPGDKNRNIVIRGNMIHGFASASRCGVRVINEPTGISTNCHILDNTIDSAKTVADSVGIGIWVDASGWDVTENKIFGYDKGIQMNANCNGNIIDSNKIKNINAVAGSTNGAITMYGTNNRSIRNIIINSTIGHRIISSGTNNKMHDNVYIGVTTQLSNAGGVTNVETSGQVL